MTPPAGSEEVADRVGGFSLLELAAAVHGEVLGDGEVRIQGIRSLSTATHEDLAFASDASHQKQAAESAACALLVSQELAEPLGGGTHRPLVVVKHPKVALGQLIPLFHPTAAAPVGIHPTAVVGADCAIEPSASVGPYVVLGDRCRVAAGVVLHAHVVVGDDCQVGAGSVLYPHAVLYAHCHLGERVIVHAGTVLGADGFGYATVDGKHVKLPHAGSTVLENDVEVGALSAIDRAILEETRIGAGSKIDNLVQVGHNVNLGRGCLLCGQSGIAGSARLEDYVVLGGQAGAVGHISLGRGSQVAAKSAVMQSLPVGSQVAGVPAIDLSTWRRQALMAPRIGELAKRIRVLEKQLESLAPKEKTE